jgi:hypothetical protein
MKSLIFLIAALLFASAAFAAHPNVVHRRLVRSHSVPSSPIGRNDNGGMGKNNAHHK